MQDAIPTVGVLVYKDGKVLLVKHTEGSDHLTGKYGLPSGAVNEDETEIEAAMRKLTEETGLISDDLIKLPTIYHAKIERKNGLRNFSLTVFLCNEFSGELEEGNAEIPQWIEIEKLDEHNLLPNVKKAIIAGLSYL